MIKQKKISMRGYSLSTNEWRVEAPIANLVIVHGFSEHSGRYAHCAEFFNQHGISVLSYDQQGHGLSEGARAKIDSIEALSADLELFLQSIQRSDPRIPLFVWGHSMGGLVVADALAKTLLPLAGAITTGIALVVNNINSSLLMAFLERFGRYIPASFASSLDATTISRDPAVIGHYMTDPLVYHGTISPLTGLALLQGAKRVLQKAESVTLPLLIMHGEEDRLISAESSLQWYASVGSADKTLKLYPNLHHELHNEPEKNSIMGEMAVWIETHLTIPAPRITHHQRRTQREQA